MITLSKIEKAKLKQWIRDGEGSYEICVKLLGDYKTRHELTTITGGNAFESLRELHTTQGRVNGAIEIFDIIEQQAE